jgi:hypothetical protein
LAADDPAEQFIELTTGAVSFGSGVFCYAPLNISWQMIKDDAIQIGLTVTASKGQT